MLMPTRRAAAPRIRKDASRAQLAVRGLGAVAVLALLLGLLQLRTSGAWGGPPEVSADLRNAGGSLAPGSDVKLRGVVVGRVDEIVRGPAGGVRVRLAMDESQLGRVPADVVARILPATVFGTSYVDLRPTSAGPATAGSAGRPALRPGAVVPADASQGTLELQQALDDIDRLVKALGPAELATAIGAASVALEGRGEQIGHTLDSLDVYLTRFTPKLRTVREDLSRLADLLEVVEQIAPDLLDATDDGLVALKTLVEHRDDLEAVLVDGARLARSGNAFLAANTDQLTRFVQNAHRLLDAVYDNKEAGITGAIRANRQIAGIVRRAVAEGYLKVDAPLRIDEPGYYGPGDRP
jgi:phospholipid/cholesterol/gamma-HCH transport system substrate-binding protein